MEVPMKEIPGFDGYLCDGTGSIYSTRKGRFVKMTPVLDKHGYLRIHIPPTVGAKRKNVFIHTLVALAHFGSPESGIVQVNHKNGKRDDNHPDNLEWTTTVENARHSWNRIRDQRSGENHGISKLTDVAVTAARRAYVNGEGSYAKLAKAFGVSKRTMICAIKGIHWRHV
jgi:hypothetical protein